MAKLPEEVLNEVKMKVNKAFDRAIVKGGFNKQLAVAMAKQIVKRTRLGKGVDKGGKVTRLRPLSSSYKDVRKGKITFFMGWHGKVVSLSKINNKELKSLRASKGASKQQKKINAFINKRKPKLDKTTRPAKSNLTLTGQLLRSIRGFARGRKIIIAIVKNKRNEDGITNSQIIDIQEQNGRRFFDLATFEIAKFTRLTKKRILDQIESDLK